MENGEENLENQHANALSIYGQADAAMDDFPVLKAFQQYIDAEQSKSRKRMILLCMFFGVLMTVVVAVFVIILGQMSRDKQHVNDQLIEFLMKERERAPAATVVQPMANPATDAALKAMTETLVALQEQVAEQKKAAADEAALAPTKAELELQRKSEREAAKLRRAQEQLEADKRRLQEEKERLRQEEVERQRRRLYPEYYEKKTTETPSPAPVAKPTPKKVRFSDEDIDDILREVDSLRAADAAKEKTKAKKESARKSKAKKDVDDKATMEDKPIEYFTESEYALPVRVNGEDSGWSLPLPAEEDAR